MSTSAAALTTAETTTPTSLTMASQTAATEATYDSDSDSDSSRVAPKQQQQHTTTKQRAAVRAKTAEDDELERLVFGDSAHFRQQIRLGEYLSTGEDAHQLQLVAHDADDDNENLGAVDDDQLFALDTAPTKSASTALVAAASTDNKCDRNAPVWDDSDDERLTVSLATVSRLRKLRVSEVEDVVNGAEYTRRLRQQFLRLSPMPKWAVDAEAAVGRPAKKRRTVHDSDDDDNTGSETSDSDNIDSDASDDEDLSTQPLANFLRSVNTTTIAPKALRLRPGTLDIQRSRDIPDKHHGAVTSLSFHPLEPILLSSSPAGLLRLHRLHAAAHPTAHPQIVSVQAKQVDVRRSQIVGPRGERVIFAGRRRHVLAWSLETGQVTRTEQIQGRKGAHRSMERFRASPCGRWLAIQASAKRGGSTVDVVSAVTMQWVAGATMDSRHGIADFAWWADGEGLTVLGRDGRVGEWSLSKAMFLRVWWDEGSVGGTVLGLGGKDAKVLGGDRWIAVGSTSGIVNIYDRVALLPASTSDEVYDSLPAKPSPTKTVENLTTSITTVTFSPDGQLLAVASQRKRDALKLVHLPSCTVYQNWPTEQTPLGRVTAMAFAKGSSVGRMGEGLVLAVGNDKGGVRLWDVRG